MYTRERTCGDQQLVRICLQEYGVRAFEINISREPDAAQTMLELTGCLSVPTLVVVDENDNPIEPPHPVDPDLSVRNVDRGSLISEPSRDGLRKFLVKHGLLT